MPKSDGGLASEQSIEALSSGQAKANREQATPRLRAPVAQNQFFQSSPKGSKSRLGAQLSNLESQKSEKTCKTASSGRQRGSRRNIVKSQSLEPGPPQSVTPRTSQKPKRRGFTFKSLSVDAVQPQKSMRRTYRSAISHEDYPAAEDSKNAQQKPPSSQVQRGASSDQRYSPSSSSRSNGSNNAQRSSPSSRLTGRSALIASGTSNPSCNRTREASNSQKFSPSHQARRTMLSEDASPPSRTRTRVNSASQNSVSHSHSRTRGVSSTQSTSRRSSRGQSKAVSPSRHRDNSRPGRKKATHRRRRSSFSGPIG